MVGNSGNKVNSGKNEEKYVSKKNAPLSSIYLINVLYARYS